MCKKREGGEQSCNNVGASHARYQGRTHCESDGYDVESVGECVLLKADDARG